MTSSGLYVEAPFVGFWAGSSRVSKSCRAFGWDLAVCWAEYRYFISQGAITGMYSGWDVFGLFVGALSHEDSLRNIVRVNLFTSCVKGAVKFEGISTAVI